MNGVSGRDCSTIANSFPLRLLVAIRRRGIGIPSLTSNQANSTRLRADLLCGKNRQFVTGQWLELNLISCTGNASDDGALPHSVPVLPPFPLHVSHQLFSVFLFLIDMEYYLTVLNKHQYRLINFIEKTRTHMRYMRPSGRWGTTECFHCKHARTSPDQPEHRAARSGRLSL